MFTLLAAVTVLEVALVKNKLALPDAAVDYSVWIIWVVIFMRMYGFSPKYWVKRGRGIAIMVVGTLFTLPLFYLLERATGTLGRGLRLADPVQGARAGQSEYRPLAHGLHLPDLLDGIRGCNPDERTGQESGGETLTAAGG